MSLFELKVLKRSPGDPALEQSELSAIFEAVDHDAAKAEAYRRSRTLPAHHFAWLRSAKGEDLGTWEPPVP